MPLIARQRSRLAVLAVLALVGSLLAVSAVPAVAAVDDTADNPAGYSACVGAATADEGFTDMGSSFAADAANCLVHYGISSGTGDGSTFSPQRVVTRLQMARFLSRAAGPAGIDTMAVEAQGLTDISDLSEEAQNAVDTVVSLGIMEAGSDDTFDPAGIVTRVDMAVHISAFLAKALNGPGGALDDLQSDTGLESDDAPFTDIDGVSFGAYGAIKDIFELGITEGTTPTTFGPDLPVSRAQMAAFITRALAHTNARPAGLSAQGPADAITENSADISVSVRDEDHQPVPDVLVDAITSTTPDEAFDDAGECTDELMSLAASCSISTSDEATDPDGNADLQVGTPISAGTLTVWVWTGDSGDDFDADTTDSVMLEIDAALPAIDTTASLDMKEHATRLKFGDTVTLTFQLVNSEGDPVALAGKKVTVTATEADASVTVAENGAETALSPGRPNTRTTETTHTTDEAGQIQVTFTADDPDSDSPDAQVDRISLTLTLSVAGDGDEVAVNSGRDGFDDQDDGGIDVKYDDLDETATGKQAAVWSDEASTPSTLTIDQAINYHEIETDGGAVGNTMTATLVDQYGDPVRGKKIGIWSTGAQTSGEDDGSSINGDAPIDFRTTNRNGVATKRYSVTLAADTGFREVLQASYAVDGTDVIAATDVGDVTHYWALTTKSANSGTDILAVDTDNNSIVLAGPTLVTYKSGDYFVITGTGGVSMETFEKELEDTDTLEVATNPDSGISTFTLSA